jgi:hypothetical protein
LLDALKNFTCFDFIDKVEADISEVSASKADGGELAGGCRSRAQGTESDDGVCKPELSRSDYHTLYLVFGGNRGCVREDKVVRGEMEGTIDLLTAASQGHIVNLERHSE